LLRGVLLLRAHTTLLNEKPNVILFEEHNYCPRCFLLRCALVDCSGRCAFLRRLGCGLHWASGQPQRDGCFICSLCGFCTRLNGGGRLGLLSHSADSLSYLSLCIERTAPGSVSREVGVAVLRSEVCLPLLVPQLYRVHNSVPITFVEYLECVYGTICFRWLRGPRPRGTCSCL